MDDAQVAVEMPRYQSHKKVWALEITKATRNYTAPKDPEAESAPATCTLEFADPGYAPQTVPWAVVGRYFPQPGDFLVVYDDNYQSISPRKAFLDGYTRL